MTTAGVYNYHPKVEHPSAMYIQMESGGFQPPFFFGGSQVPVSLQTPHHELTDRMYEHSLHKLEHMKGSGIHIEGKGKRVFNKSFKR